MFYSHGHQIIWSALEILPTARSDTSKSVTFVELVQMTVISDMVKIKHNQKVHGTIFLLLLFAYRFKSSLLRPLHYLDIAK